MKPLFFALFIIVLAGCSKDPNAATTQGSMSYKVNGGSINMENVIFSKQLKGNIIPSTRYLLNGQSGSNNIIIFAIVSDSLQKINYHYDSAWLHNNSYNVYTVNYNGQSSSLLRNGDYFDISISDYQGGRVSGTFSAKFSGQSSGSTLITEGKLNNVEVIY